MKIRAWEHNDILIYLLLEKLVYMTQLKICMGAGFQQRNQ